MLLIISSSCRNNILEKNYELDYNPNHEINLVITEDGYQLVKIPGHILFYGHNKDYIIVNQKSTDGIYERKENRVYDSILNEIAKPKSNQFWIIVLKNDIVYGPLTKHDYLLRREELKVPNEFKLDNSTLDFYNIGQRSDIEYSFPDSETVDIENLKGNLNKHINN